ncbi:MAG TPA: trypsin-like peptidase domain-containing protein [Acetobacteraceae bacterium]|jgi:serine protease Do|nr:trypsin-like peptidase domain-containing protein [Acetobacteraceae bacterium]
MISRTCRAVLVLLALALPAWPHAAAAQQMEMMEPSQAALIHSLLPTVVNIHSDVGIPVPAPGSDARVAMSSPAKSNSLEGSGFIVDPSGMIVTNYHVIAGAYAITVMFADGTRVPATLVGAATGVDIAVIKVDIGHPLPVTHWGNSEKVEIGDTVFAIGNPLGIGLSVSSGIISALNRNIMDSPYDNYIQTDAAINHGNSGGPLFNREGQVIGMDTAIVSPTTGSVGLGFAIPSNETRFCADQLIRFGHVQPGFLGIKVEQVTSDMAEALGMAEPEGSIVALIHPGSPAEVAGVRVGDIVLSYDGKTPSDERALLREIAMTPIGKVVPLVIRRGATTQTLQVTITKWPPQLWAMLNPVETTVAPKLDIPRNLGLSLQPMTDDLRARYSLTMHQPGVLVAGVAAGTDAARRGLVAGDVLLRVQDAAVRTPEEVQAAIDAARADKRSFVIALILPKKQDMPGPRWMALQVAAP